MLTPLLALILGLAFSAASLGVYLYLRRRAPGDLSGRSQILGQILSTFAAVALSIGVTAYVAIPTQAEAQTQIGGSAQAEEPTAHVEFNDLQDQDVVTRCVRLRGVSRLEPSQAVVAGIRWVSGRPDERWFWTSDLDYNTSRTEWSVDLVLGQKAYRADAANFQVRAAVVPRVLAEYLASTAQNDSNVDTSWSSPMDLPQTAAVTPAVTVVKGPAQGDCPDAS